MSDAMPEQPFPMRLQKFLARAGVASRRGSEDLMTAGRVSVNGQVVTELGSKVDPKVDVVCVDGREVHLEDDSAYLVLYKPKGYLTTMDDPQGRPCVAQLVPRDLYPGLYPVGRLDQDTTGLLLFTTDGDMGQHLPASQAPCRQNMYQAHVDGVPNEVDLARLSGGISARRRSTRRPARVRIVAERPDGGFRYRARHSRGQKASAVKRMCSAVRHPVLDLHRSSFGPA